MSTPTLVIPTGITERVNSRRGEEHATSGAAEAL
jgi:hypothetical protein